MLPGAQLWVLICGLERIEVLFVAKKPQLEIGGKMPDEDREKIMEKRASLRSWRERGGKMPRNVEFIGAGLIAIIFLALIASSFLDVPQINNTTEQPKKTPVPTPAPVSAKSSTSLSPVSIPAPSIKINSPENITYNTGTPPLDFIVAGSNLDSVLLSVDGGPQVAVPHDGTIARIDFAKGDPLFIEDFSGGAQRWKNRWKVVDGKYASGSGTTSTGGAEWNNYTFEAKIKLESGKDINVQLKSDDNEKNYYRLQTADAYGSITLYKIEKDETTEKGYIVRKLTSSSLPKINPADWHTWKITSNGSDVGFFLDDVQHLKINDPNPYLNGKISLATFDSLAYFDNIVIYKTLGSGPHSLTIFANNTNGNTSSQTVYFTVNSSLAKADEVVVGKIGVPVVKKGFEITVKSVISSNQYTSVWLSVKNLEDNVKTLKLGPGNIIIDDKGQQYESIKVPRSAELVQTDIYPLAMREGGVYFEKLGDNSRRLQRLVLYVNGEKLEFLLNVSKP